MLPCGKIIILAMEEMIVTQTEKQKMLAGELYTAVDDEIQADQAAARQWMEHYNRSIGLTPQQHAQLLQQGLGAVGDNCVVRPPFHFDYGYNITLGHGVFMNFNCVILDVVQVDIGAGALIMPGVTIGDDALIGAGSGVTRDVAPGVTVVGNPARPR